MQIKPSSDVLQALGALPVDRAAARPKVAAARAAPPVQKQLAVKPADAQPGRNYRPGTFLDIYV